NNTAQDIELTWQMLDNEFTSNNWQYVSFCDPYICHNDIPNTFSPPLVANKTSDSVSEFKLAATPKITARTSKMRIIVWQTGQSQVDTLTFEIDALPMSIADEKAAVNTFAAYPNPAKNTLTLGFDPKSNYTVTVYSMNGAAMMSSKLTANQKTLNVETLPAGLYFINATDEKGNLSVSKFSKL
ncbi:MAG: T9SS type A sorting domain-containing protein, partial [Sphingobacteriales bacterium]